MIAPPDPANPGYTLPDARGCFHCIKCESANGNDWTQCSGACPIPGTPHYDPTWVVPTKPRLGDVLILPNGTRQVLVDFGSELFWVRNDCGVMEGLEPGIDDVDVAWERANDACSDPRPQDTLTIKGETWTVAARKGRDHLLVKGRGQTCHWTVEDWHSYNVQTDVVYARPSFEDLQDATTWVAEWVGPEIDTDSVDTDGGEDVVTAWPRARTW